MVMLQTMYPGVANSPNTFLKEDLAKDATVMYLSDGSVLGTLPTLAVIGGGADAETVLVTSTAAGGGYAIQRGVEGKKKAWKKADLVARNWTNKDYEAVRANIEAINDDKVDKVAGKGLSTHDYDDEAKDKVDAIPPDPKYTDTVPDMSKYATLSLYEEISNDFTREINRLEYNIGDARNSISYDVQNVSAELTEDINNVKTAHDADIQSVRADIKTRLADMTEDSEHRTVTDAEKKAWNGKVDAVSGKGLSTNDYTTAEKEKVARMKESVVLTQSEYDALSTSDKDDDNKIYFIRA